VIDDKTINKMLARVVWIFLFLFIYFQHVGNLCVQQFSVLFIFQHVCNLFSFVFITMINKCITHALMLWLVMMIESLCYDKI